MGKFSYVFKNTLLNMRRTPLLVFATIIAVLVSSFLVFTTLSARSIVENNTIRWQNGIHVVVFLDDRVTTTAHKQLETSLENYPEVRTVDYFSKPEANLMEGYDFTSKKKVTTNSKKDNKKWKKTQTILTQFTLAQN